MRVITTEIEKTMKLEQREVLKLIAASTGRGSFAVVQQRVVARPLTNQVVNNTKKNGLNKLIYASTDELLKKFTSLEVSPVDVLKAQIKRYEEVEKIINACTYTHFKSA